MAYEKVLTANIDNPDVKTVAGYKAAGGYKGLEAAYAVEPDEVIEQVKAETTEAA